MDITKLMIGNWVWCGSNYGQIAEFFTLTLDDELLILVNNVRNRFFEEINPHKIITGTEDIRPIPLTEEFFEKNGIKKVDYKYLKTNLLFESKNKRIQIMDLTTNGDGCWNVHIDNENYETIGSCDVKYVHQFQQLLRLCDYEMDIIV